MKLISYLEQSEISYARFAEMIGASNGKVVHRYARGEQIPSRDFMARIVEVTGGAVTPNDFYDLPGSGEAA